LLFHPAAISVIVAYPAHNLELTEFRRRWRWITRPIHNVACVSGSVLCVLEQHLQQLQQTGPRNSSIFGIFSPK